MLQPVTFSVTNADGSGVAVTASAPDYVEYEMRFNRSILQGMSDGLWSVYMFVVWHAMYRQSLTTLNWDEWLATSPTFEREIVSEEPVPLELDQPIGPLPDSQ